MRNTFMGILLGVSLHIAGLEVADLLLSSRMIACANEDMSACAQLLLGEQSTFEKIARYRPQLGLRRWRAFLESHGQSVDHEDKE